ncbi:unnamed protein product [Bathycoccus prasinos]
MPLLCVIWIASSGTVRNTEESGRPESPGAPTTVSTGRMSRGTHSPGIMVQLRISKDEERDVGEDGLCTREHGMSAFETIPGVIILDSGAQVKYFNDELFFDESTMQATSTTVIKE